MGTKTIKGSLVADQISGVIYDNTQITFTLENNITIVSLIFDGLIPISMNENNSWTERLYFDYKNMKLWGTTDGIQKIDRGTLSYVYDQSSSKYALKITTDDDYTNSLSFSDFKYIKVNDESAPIPDGVNWFDVLNSTPMDIYKVSGVATFSYSENDNVHDYKLKLDITTTKPFSDYLDEHGAFKYVTYISENLDTQAIGQTSGFINDLTVYYIYDANQMEPQVHKLLYGSLTYNKSTSSMTLSVYDNQTGAKIRDLTMDYNNNSYAFKQVNLITGAVSWKEV